MNFIGLFLSMLLQGFSYEEKLTFNPIKDGRVDLFKPYHPIKTIFSESNPVVRSDTSSCSIPFVLAGKLILIKGLADTTQGSFILDTGAPGLVLNSTYFRDYPVEEFPDEAQETITGQAGPSLRTNLKYFRLGTIHYYSISAHLVSLRHLENAKGVKILGLLGVAMFKECEIIIDYKTNMLHLHHIQKNERKTYEHTMLKDATTYNVYPFDLRENRILLTTAINGKKLPFVIDYAAESNIIDSRLPDNILDKVTINGRILLSGAGTQRVEAVTGDLIEFTVGSMRVDTMSVIVTNLEKTCFGKDNCIQGVLGYEFLSRYSIVINFVKRKLYILK